jgi:simple sugar transport system substrate-binding protein
MKFTKKLMVAASVLAISASAGSAADIAVIGGSNDDAFWNIIKKGLDDATPGIVANGGTVNYLRLVNYDNLPPMSWA